MKIHSILEGKPFMTEFGIVGYSTVVLIREEGRNILFDCGQRGCALQFVEGLAAAGITPGEVTDVVISHLHFDHVGNLPMLKNARVWMSETEWKNACSDPDDWHCAATCEYIRHNCETAYVKEGDQIAENVTVMELPGHTWGLIGLKCGEDTILCSDAIKNRYEMWENRPLMSVDEATSRRTAERIRREAKHVYPGHDTVLHLDHPNNREPVHFELRFADGTTKNI